VAGQDGLVGLRPNPIRSDGSITFRLGRDAHVRLELFDVAGRLVQTLADGRVSAGSTGWTSTQVGFPRGVLREIRFAGAPSGEAGRGRSLETS
jgi:hypothetical protein